MTREESEMREMRERDRSNFNIKDKESWYMRGVFIWFVKNKVL